MFVRRLTAIRETLKDDETFLVSNLTNIRYLIGFTGSNGLLLISKNDARFFTDSRYLIQSSKEVSGCEIVISPDIWKAAIANIETSILRIEIMHINVHRLDQILENKPTIEINKVSNTVEQNRLIKDVSEIGFIKTACDISVLALNKLTETKLVGLTEIEICTKLERYMIDAGASRPAFDSIIATGPNSAIPHHQPTDRKFEVGDLLKIDFGAEYSGYKSDCTRMFVAGKSHSWQKEIHNATLHAQELGRGLIKTEVEFTQIDGAVRQCIADAKYEDKFTHGLGHGVGLEIHEDPFLSQSSTGKVQQNMVITVEPGIYLNNQGGVRIEDTGLVSESGFEVFTSFNYELMELI